MADLGDGNPVRDAIVFVAWAILMYFHVFFVVEWMRKDTAHKGIVDLICLLLFVLVLLIYYFVLPKKDQEDEFRNSFILTVDFCNTLMGLVFNSVSIAMFYAIIYLLGISMNSESKAGTVMIFEINFWIIFILSVILVGSKNLLRIDLAYYIKRIFGHLWNGTKLEDEEEKDKEDETITKTLKQAKEEVYNIGQDLYTYSDAQAVCSAFGGRLASYDEIEEAYKSGAEWCNYGWSEGQMIFFPTQKQTFDNLQKSPLNKNACGRPGVNGGFMPNTGTRYGVNCFGVKPEPSSTEKEFLEQQQKGKIGPRTVHDKALDLKADYFKEHRDDFIHINSFNQDKWSAF